MFPPGNMPPGVQTGPSPSFMQRMKMGMAGGLNKAAQDYSDPTSQGIARQTSQLLPQNKRKKNQPQLPVNSPQGMKPATNIMQTPGGAPNPYSSGESRNSDCGIVRGPSAMPFPLSPMPPTSVVPMGGMQQPGMQQTNPFWNMYNQNRPPMMG